MRKTLRTMVVASMMAFIMTVPGMTAGAQAQDYILLLPASSEITYDFDGEHEAKQYSTENYTVLLYDAGESVEFTVTASCDYTIEDAAEGTVFEDYTVSGDTVTFVMPDTDLCLIPEAGHADVEENSAETLESGTVDSDDISADQGTAAERTKEKYIPESAYDPETDAGEECITFTLLGGMSAELLMVDGSIVEVEEDGNFSTENKIDLFDLYFAEGGYYEAPDFYIYRNGELVEDHSPIVMVYGGDGETYRIDLINKMSLDGFYEFFVVNADADITPPETEEEAETESETETETETELETNEVLESPGAVLVFGPSGNMLVYGEDFTFVIEIEAGYSKTDDFAVMSNGVPLDENADGSYTIHGVTDNQNITVEGVADITGPEVLLSIDGEELSLQDDEVSYTYDAPVNVTADVTDSGSGLDTVQYYLASDAVSSMEEISEWDDYDGNITVDIPGEEHLYVKAVDEAGNETFTETAIILDMEKSDPSITVISSLTKFYDGLPVEDPEYTLEGTGKVTVEYKKADDDDSAFVTEAPTEPGDYVLRVTSEEDERYTEGTLEATFSIFSLRSAPVLSATAETASGKADGTISGLSDSMEYSMDGEAYTAVTDPSMEFEAGTYYVRYAADDTNPASSVAEITIEEGRKLAVIFVADSNIVEICEIDYGGSIPESEIPEVPEKEGCDMEQSCWDSDSFDDITSDMIVHAVYQKSVLTVSFSTTAVGGESSGEEGTETETAESEEPESEETEQEETESEEAESAETEEISGETVLDGEEMDESDYDFSVIVFGDITAEAVTSDGSVETAEQDDTLTLRDKVSEVRVYLPSDFEGDPEILLSRNGMEVKEDADVYHLDVDSDGIYVVEFDEDGLESGSSYILIISD